MKRRNLIAVILTLALLACSLVACNSGNGEQTPTTALIEVYDSENNIFLRDKEFKVTEGMTVKAAIEALCADRGYTVEFDATGAFEKFADNGEGDEKVVLEAKQVKKEGTDLYDAYYLAWVYNDEEMGLKVPADTVLKPGDKVVVKFNVEKDVAPDNK